MWLNHIMHRVMNTKPLLFLMLVVSAPVIACKGELRTFEIKDERGVILGKGTVREFFPTREKRPGRGFILPTTAGENIIDRFHARELCKAGLFSQLLVSWPDSRFDLFDPRMHDDFFRLVRLSMQTLLGHDPSPVAFIGTSLGGITGASLIALEPRIKVAALISAGTHIAQILSYSDHSRARRQTEGSMERQGIKTIAAYERFLARHISIDSSDLLPRARHELPETFHIVTTEDLTVPTRTQEDLVKLFPRPTVKKIKTNHFVGIVTAGTRELNEISDFLIARMPKAE